MNTNQTKQDLIDLLSAIHLNKSFSDKRQKDLLEILKNNAELRIELSQEVQMAANTKAVQMNDSRWLKLNEIINMSEQQTEDQIFEDRVFSDLENMTSSRSPSNYWLKQVATLLIGFSAGLFGLGVVWAVNTPKAIEMIIGITSNSFDMEAGPLPQGFPKEAGVWSGDTAQIVNKNGNQCLKFISPNSDKNNTLEIAKYCDIFQIVDLTDLAEKLNSNEQKILTLSGLFSRGKNKQNYKVYLHLYLFSKTPAQIEKIWPHTEHAITKCLSENELSFKELDLKLSGSCILVEKAKTAVIQFSVKLDDHEESPSLIEECFLDDVELKVSIQPNLPIQMVTK